MKFHDGDRKVLLGGGRGARGEDRKTEEEEERETKKQLAEAALPSFRSRFFQELVYGTCDRVDQKIKIDFGASICPMVSTDVV